MHITLSHQQRHMCEILLSLLSSPILEPLYLFRSLTGELDLEDELQFHYNKRDRSANPHCSFANMFSSKVAVASATTYSVLKDHFPGFSIQSVYFRFSSVSEKATCRLTTWAYRLDTEDFDSSVEFI